MDIQGKLINFKVRENGTADAFKALACTEDSQFQITNETTERRTNCGIKTGIADATFNASGNAVQEIPAAADHVSYNEVKGWQKTKTKLDFTYENEADGDIAEGDAISITGSGYFTDSTYSASAEADGIGSFSWTFTGTGILDEFDDES